MNGTRPGWAEAKCPEKEAARKMKIDRLPPLIDSGNERIFASKSSVLARRQRVINSWNWMGWTKLNLQRARSLLDASIWNFNGACLFSLFGIISQEHNTLKHLKPIS